jgi:tRNA pseudouridine32 synthase/23S rRNA pseudouridine746 synthase
MPLIKDEFFIPFKGLIDTYPLPDKFTLLIDNQPHALCLLAAEELQIHLKKQDEWQHNFGLLNKEKGTIIGKMFGVLVVKTKQNEIGYLAAFSGKLAGGNHHNKFVPPVFDSLTDNSFLNNGMIELTRINQEIKKLGELNLEASTEKINILKTERKSNSIALQNKLFDNYLFFNKAGKEKSLQAIFKDAFYKNPPSGAGECAAPKLLQYAFKQAMQPLAMAEFWWGQSPKSIFWKHGNFYPCCKEKCEPILAHMLEGIDMSI